jgi:hypothetical protein
MLGLHMDRSLFVRQETRRTAGRGARRRCADEHGRGEIGRFTIYRLLAALLAVWTPLVAAGGERCSPRPGALCAEMDLRGAQLRGADLRIADLSGSDLSGADLRGANLRNADLDGAVLRGADLTGANLADAALRSADLRGAIVKGANFAGADMRGCRGCPQAGAAEDSAAEK